MSVLPSELVADAATSRVIAQHVGRLPGEAVCDPCIATATGFPLTTVARATTALIQNGAYTGWTGTCPRCGELRPVVRLLAVWRRPLPRR
jgi:hypothetical protein